MERKILVLDIDGTLVNSKKEITPKTQKAIAEIMDMGHICMLASGRPTPGMLHIAKKLEFEKRGGYLLAYNGAEIINCATGEILFCQPLEHKYLADMAQFAKQHKCGVLTYSKEAIISGNGIDEYVHEESKMTSLSICEKDFAEIDFPVNKCLMTAEPKRAEELCKLLVEKYDGKLAVFRSMPFFIEIVSLGIDKAYSISIMLEKLGIARENCICCGDGYNDLSMIEFAGVGVAMGNAIEEVKKIADFITLSNDEDGVAYAIEKFIK